jgi:dihydrodipicolinate reductase
LKVVVIGASGHGRQVIDAIEASGEHDVVGVLDRALEPGTEVVG